MKIGSCPLAGIAMIAFMGMVAAGPSAPAQDGTAVVWDSTWDAAPDERWMDAPAGTWIDKGVLLVRVAYGPGIRGCWQLLPGGKRQETKPKDYTIETDVIEKLAREAGVPQSWAWCATGHGRVRVQVIWFRHKRDAERHLQQHPYDADFAPSVLVPVLEPPVVPGLPGGGHDPFALVAPVWEHAFEATDPPAWFQGPARTWNHREGALLVRIAGTQHLRALLWRAGSEGAARELPPGDHLLGPDVLERPPANPLELVLGGAAPLSFHFAGLGRGPVRVQILWLPHRDLGPPWCASHAFLPPGAGAPPPALIPVPPALPDIPAGDPRTAPGFVTVRFLGALASDASGAPLAGSDIIVQMEAWPRTIYGGARTDAEGRFTFDTAVPAGIPLVLRVPESRSESTPRTFPDAGPEWRWDVRLR